MEDTYIIKGNNPLKGHVQLSGAKNIALKVIIAALLFSNKVVIINVPNIKDIEALIDLLRYFGAEIEFINNTLTIDPRNLTLKKVDLLQASKTRVTFLLFAPFLYRFKKAEIPNPGGCRLGARSIDRIVEGLLALGVKIKYISTTGYYEASLEGRVKGNYTFKKTSHTGTEMLILMSVFCENIVTIHNAALEPEIDDLILFLNEGGAAIKREGNSIVVKGVKVLQQKKPYTILSDRIEAITYAVSAIATGGDITISKIPDTFIKSFVDLLYKIGVGVEKNQDGLWRFYYRPFTATDIETSPYPGFLTDWQPLCALLLTQARGNSLIHERLFENRFSYVEELQKLGAKIIYKNVNVNNPKEYYFFNYDISKKYNQSILITGPQKLHAGVLNVSDLRAGATIAIAALMANGISYISGVHHIERGYENFVEKIRALGGNIKKI